MSALAGAVTAVKKNAFQEDSNRIQEFITIVRDLQSQIGRLKIDHSGASQGDTPPPKNPSSPGPENLRWSIQLLGEELSELSRRITSLENAT